MSQPKKTFPSETEPLPKETTINDSDDISTNFTEPVSNMLSNVDNAAQVDVWVKLEVFQATKIKMNATSDIDDLKKATLNGQDHCHFYEASHLNQQLSPGEIIPLNTTSQMPVILKKSK